MLFRIGLMAVSLMFDYSMHVWLKDEPPYDDSHLIPVRRELADEDNAYGLFKQAWKNYIWLEPEVEQERLAFFEDEVSAFGHPDWDFEFVEGLLADNAETLKLFDAGVQKGKLQAPEVKSINSLMPYLSPWRQLAVLSRLRAAHLYNTGRHQEAFQGAIDTVKFGSMIENSEGPMITFVVGVACNGMGLQSLREMLPDIELTSAELRDCVQQIQPLQIDIEKAANVFRYEYFVSSNVVDDYSPFEIVNMISRWPPEEDQHLDRFRRDWFYGSRLFVRPNATKRLYGEYYTEYLNKIAVYATERAKMRSEEEFLMNILERSRQFSGNYAGINLFLVTAGSFDSVIERKSKSEVSLHATRLLIALKAYKLDHGELPDTLDTLVPDYINAVPLDDFDGKPMRYDRGQRIIYSVGENLEDDGGDELNDIVVKIKF